MERSFYTRLITRVELMNHMNPNVKSWSKSIQMTLSYVTLTISEYPLNTLSNQCIWSLHPLETNSYNSVDHVILINYLKSTIETRLEWNHKRLSFLRVMRSLSVTYTTNHIDIQVVSSGLMGSCCKSISSMSVMMRMHWITRSCWNMGKAIRCMTIRYRKCQLESVLLTYTTTFYMKTVWLSYL